MYRHIYFRSRILRKPSCCSGSKRFLKAKVLYELVCLYLRHLVMVVTTFCPICLSFCLFAFFCLFVFLPLCLFVSLFFLFFCLYALLSALLFFCLNLPYCLITSFLWTSFPCLFLQKIYCSCSCLKCHNDIRTTNIVSAWSVDKGCPMLTPTTGVSVRFSTTL